MFVFIIQNRKRKQICFTYYLNILMGIMVLQRMSSMIKASVKGIVLWSGHVMIWLFPTDSSISRWIRRWASWCTATVNINHSTVSLTVSLPAPKNPFAKSCRTCSVKGIHRLLLRIVLNSTITYYIFSIYCLFYVSAYIPLN